MELAKYRDPALHVLASLAWIASLVYIPGVRIDSNVLDWLPDDHEAVQNYVAGGEAGGFAFDMLMVLPLRAEHPHGQIADVARTQLIHAGMADVGSVIARNGDDRDAVFRFQIRTTPGRDARQYVQADQDRALRSLDTIEADLLRDYGDGFRAPPKLAGTPVTNRALNDVVLRRGAPIIGLSYLVLFGLLILFLYDRPPMLFVSFTAMTLASLSTFAYMGYADIPLNLMTVSVPSLVLILSIADVLHISRHLRAHPGDLAGVFAPCFWTTVTTGAGFASLMFTRLPILSGFAAAAAVGICAAFFWSFYAFHLTRAWHQRPAAPELSAQRAERLGFGRYIAPQLPHLRPAAFALIVLAGLALTLAPQLKADTNPIDYLPRDDRTYQDLTWIHQHHFSPYRLDFRLDYDPQNANKPHRPPYAEALRNVQETLKNHGYTDVHYLPLLDEGAPAMRVSVGVPPETSSKGLRDEVRKITRLEFAGFPNVKAEGFLQLFSLIVDNLLRTQIYSGLVALALIFLILAVIFRRGRYVLAGILFNVAPITLTLAYMVLADIPLDISTVCVASIAAGIVVDDTIHLLWAARRFRDSDDADGFAVTLTAATQTTLIVCCGFAVLALSGVRTIHLFGSLLAITVGAAWLFDVLAMSFFVRRRQPESER